MDRWDVIAVTCTQADHANAFSQGLVSLLRRFEGRVVCMQIVVFHHHNHHPSHQLLHIF